MDFTHQVLVFLMILSNIVSESQVFALKLLPNLNGGDSLGVKKLESDRLVSPNGTFSCGFYNVGTNAFCFSIWFTDSAEKTVVWMANRDSPVGKGSTVTLHGNGNLVLTGADGSVVWSTDTSTSRAGPEVRVLETGNLVVVTRAGEVLWESFAFPMDTVLATQPITKNTTLVSMRSRGTYLSGFYNLKFDDNNVLVLIFNDPLLSSVYLPESAASVFSYNRIPYNSSRVAVLDELGKFLSSDNWKFNASDYGIRLPRRLTLDYDGVLRLYSLEKSTGLWSVTYVAFKLDACKVSGLCGEYGVCTYNLQATCSCPKGFKRNDPSDWTKGCSRTFNLTCNSTDIEFMELPLTDFYGYDMTGYATGLSLEACRNICRVDCRCKGFGYSLDGYGTCYPKNRLLNGYQMPNGRVSMHLRVPKHVAAEGGGLVPSDLQCSDKEVVFNPSVASTEEGTNKNWYMKYLIGFVAAIGGIEIICIGLGYMFVFRKNVNEELLNRGYLALALEFRRFTFAELKKATGNFSQEIGKGGFGTVYKGLLDGERVVAVKRLEGNLQGGPEFWSEVSVIGKINHMNLVKLWGYCAENEHKLLVYEYMENGSVDKILFSSESSGTVLEWEKRYSIAVGTAKGLSYLHEECLEWVLHCDVKPQNILLNDRFEPKVADFGMSKLFKEVNDLGFSRVRGTRGYLAPEWMRNLKIDAKADVYSYGIVLLELVSGKSSPGFLSGSDQGFNNLVDWFRQKISLEGVESVIDPRLGDHFDREKVERLVKVGLLCAEEDRNVRPAMSKVELLLGQD